MFLTSLVLQPVGCDGELYSSKTVDRCGVCGGNGASCQRISGSYRKALTQLGNTHTNTHVDRCVYKYILCTILLKVKSSGYEFGYTDATIRNMLDQHSNSNTVSHLTLVVSFHADIFGFIYPPAIESSESSPIQWGWIKCQPSVVSDSSLFLLTMVHSDDVF